MNLVFTHAALDVLRSIRAYTLETWGQEQEVCYLDTMWAKFDSLCQDPDRYRQCPDLSPDVASPPRANTSSCSGQVLNNSKSSECYTLRWISNVIYPPIRKLEKLRMLVAVLLTTTLFCHQIPHVVIAMQWLMW